MKQTAKLFKALSDPTRLRLLNLLLSGELCVCDLMAVLDMPQSTVSRHLATLRHAGLVDDNRRGQWMYYSIAETETEFSRQILDLLTTKFDSQETARNDLTKLKRHQTDSKQPCT